ncbi:helix-turn-helix domain-containing protein [Tropicimonas sp. TH_r6]|uniref:helix-turn-helix domain-containing protein n=1 Tax=Tropicimonas sp. TH_r6 TaxID=3082085 RepID=UPI0029536DE8|nr:helix-turn-helix domain-containing protein [Tropicimonas sp. TH_r6]MDV7142896.1 helix-turn-helix domain-containing protein [Tropicimonas sp. TH_r6]
MIGRNEPPKVEEGQSPPKGFDDFDLRLGDVMRGERATMGKSLLDVQRELKIKASFIAAIENSDPSAFETPGFVAGYVRSYSRYLGLDPEWAFETFCRESSFVAHSTADKLAAPASTKPVYRKSAGGKSEGYDPFKDPRVSFAPKPVSPLTSLEPRAIGSTLVLLALIGAVSYGGWSVLQEIQRVNVTPVERAPTAVAVVDPLADVKRPEDAEDEAVEVASGAPVDSLDRLYRPQTLDRPVMTARDGPIAALDPRDVGALAGVASASARGARVAAVQPGETGLRPDPGLGNAIDAAVAEAVFDGPATPRVTEDVPEVVLVAVRPAWVRVRAADGSTIFEKILNPGDTYVVPQTEEPPTLRTGAAGAVYFAVNGVTYGPAGSNGAVVDKIALNSAALTDSYTVAEASDGSDAQKAVAVAEAMLSPEPSPVDTSAQE